METTNEIFDITSDDKMKLIEVKETTNKIYMESINVDTDRSWGNGNYTSVYAENGRLRIKTEMVNMDGKNVVSRTEVALTNDEARKLAIQLLQYIEVADA